MKKILFIFIYCFSFTLLFSYESVNSQFEDYFETLTILGEIDPSSLNYSSYSTNEWDGKNSGPWKDKYKEHEIFQVLENSYFRILDTSTFQSYNLNTPHGMNDGSLWQGRGYNMQLEGGFAFISPYLEIIIDPELNFSQNLDYDIQDANSFSGSEYGYMYTGIDLPQRFGDDAFWYWDYGQSQIRFNYNSWTLGFGNEEVWIGPGEQNALIMSNNAGGYPHIDFGLNKTETRFGDIEFRMWWGWLKSSDYLETDPDEYQDFISGISISYVPAFFPDLTFGFHRTAQTAFEDYTYASVLEPVNFSFLSGIMDFGRDDYDGRGSVSISWKFPESGAEIYGEVMREDNSPYLSGWIACPEHTLAYTAGIKKVITTEKSSDNYFLFTAELTSMEWSTDYLMTDTWGGGFYRHHLTNLGYTYDGQLLGAGIGPGSNYQYTSLDYYTPIGSLGGYFSRYKLDDTILYSSSFTVDDDENEKDYIPVELTLGIKGTYFIDQRSSISADLAYLYYLNWNLDPDEDFSGMYISLLYTFRY